MCKLKLTRGLRPQIRKRKLTPEPAGTLTLTVKEHCFFSLQPIAAKKLIGYGVRFL